MILSKFLSGEPSLTRELLEGLRSPIWNTHRSSAILSDDYKVEVGKDETCYRMVIPGRSEEEIDISAIGTYLVVSAKTADWLPAQKFTFGLPPNPAGFRAELADGVLTVFVEHAKSTSKEGKITITKKK